MSNIESLVGYEIKVCNEDCLVVLYCRHVGEGYQCYAINELVGRAHHDLSLFLLNKTYPSIDTIKYIAYAILHGTSYGCRQNNHLAYLYNDRTLAH